MTWPFVYDGIPILYYGEDSSAEASMFSMFDVTLGQEQGYTGGAVPNNREA
jgi:hypothetical protein